MQYSRDRVQPGQGSYGSSLHRTQHTTHKPTNIRDAPLYPLRQQSSAFDERYTPSLATSTPSSSPTTASSSPPPPTSPLSSSFNAYRHSAGYTYRPREYDVREPRDAAVKVRAQSPAYPSGHRYAYAPPRAAVFDDEYDDVLPSSPAPPSPSYAFHAKASYTYQRQQSSRREDRDGRLTTLPQTSAYTHARTLSSSSSAYSAASPVLPAARASSSVFVPRAASTPFGGFASRLDTRVDTRQDVRLDVRLDGRHDARHEQRQDPRHERQEPAPVAFTTPREQLARLRAAPPARTTPRLSIYDLTEDEESPRRPARAALPVAVSLPAAPLGAVSLPAAAVVTPTSVAAAGFPGAVVVGPGAIVASTSRAGGASPFAAGVSAPLAASTLVAAAVDEEDDDDDDDLIPPLSTAYPSPRRRVSFSTSAERSSSPPRGASPPARGRAGYIPVTSLLAALGPKPVRRVESRGDEQRRDERRGLATPPMSDGEGSPEVADAPAHPQPTAQPSQSALAVQQAPQQLPPPPPQQQPTPTEEETPTPRRRQRPTLLDLLSVPGPLRSPSPPVAARASAPAQVHSATSVAEEEKEESRERREVEVEERRQLPTPELTPTGEAPAPVAEAVEEEVDVETLDEMPRTPVSRARSLAGFADEAPRTPQRWRESLPPSSPPVDSSPVNVVDTPVRNGVEDEEEFVKVVDTPVRDVLPAAPVDSPIINVDDSSPLKPSPPTTLDDSPARASTLPPSSPPRDTSPAPASRASSPLSELHDEDDDVLPVVVMQREPTPRVVSRGVSAVKSRAPSVVPVKVVAGPSRPTSRPASVVPPRAQTAAPSRPASAAPTRPASAVPAASTSAITAPIPVTAPSRPPSAPTVHAPAALSVHAAVSVLLAASCSPSRASTPRYDPTENDLLSSPLSPAPSSPSLRGASVASVASVEEDVLPVLARVERERKDVREDVEEAKEVKKRPAPQDPARPSKKPRTESPPPRAPSAPSQPKPSTSVAKVVAKAKEPPRAPHKAPPAPKEAPPRTTGTRVEVRAAKPPRSVPFAKPAVASTTVAKAGAARPTVKASVGAKAATVPCKSEAKAESSKDAGKEPKPVRAPSPADDEPELERPGKPRSKGRVKRAKRPRTSEFVVSDEDEEAGEEKPRASTSALSPSAHSAPSTSSASTSAPSTSATSAPAAEPKPKKRKATSPPPDSAESADEDEVVLPPPPRKVKKRSPSLAASVFDDDEFAEAQGSSKRRRRESSSRPAPSRRRARRASHGEEASEDLMHVDWEHESPLPLGELEGMVIETLATSRATSMNADVLWRTLVGGRPVLGTMARKRAAAAVVAVKLEEGAAADEAGPMGKREWLHLLTHILASGHARSGLFGRVESSASDSDGASPRKPAAEAVSPARRQRAFRSAMRAHWYYVPERDADRERAQLIRSMMRGPGKRSETMKYKQYYWKPLAKITRWDREDEL